MSRRLVRLFPPQVESQLSKLQEHELHVVLFDGNTHFGRLKSTSSQLLTLRDLRGHEHAIALADVQEIVYDQISH